MAFNPNDRKYRMIDIKICQKCDDMGYVVGTRRCETNPTLNETWKEVCPYCMPTNKYGNLQTKLSLAPKLLEDKTNKTKNDDEWGEDLP